MSNAYGIDILVFAPHPDDAEICCGGLLLQMADQGYRTGVVDLTRGEMSSNGTLESRATETGAASALLGLSVRENLGFPDAWLFPWAGYQGQPSSAAMEPHVAQVVAVLRRLRPEIVLVPWKEARHPDHQAASQLLTHALFFSGVRKFGAQDDNANDSFRPKQVLYYPMRHRTKASFVVDISEVAARKREVLLCYESQFQRRASDHQTLINAPLALEASEARERYYGAMIGVTHGEPYRTASMMGLRDPIAHFRENDLGTPHFFEGDV